MNSTKVNIFNTLPQYASDHEEEEVPVQKSQGKQQGSRNQGDKSRNNNRQNQNRQENQQEGKREVNQKVDNQRKEEQTTQAQSKTEKPIKENRRNKKKEDRTEGEENQKTEQVQEEEKPEGLTLQEYYAKQTFSQNQPKINEVKAKITSEQLIKELGNSTLLKTRQSQQVDDRKAGKKKERLDVNHHAALTTEYADLLNFRTGFVEKEYKKRNPEDGDVNKGGQRTGGKYDRREKRDFNEKAVEKNEVPTTEEQTGEPKIENQAGETTQNENQEKVEGQDYYNRRRREEGYSYDRKRQFNNRGNRGFRGGNRQGGERRQWTEGERRPYGNKRSNQVQINVTDEAFPKLG